MAEINIDEINEEDIIDALSDIQSVPTIAKTNDSLEASSTKIEDSTTNTVSMNLDTSNISDIVELLKQVIDGKTLEISIKVKS